MDIKPCMGCNIEIPETDELCRQCQIEWGWVDAYEEDYERENNPNYRDYHAEAMKDAYDNGFEAGFSAAQSMAMASNPIIRAYWALRAILRHNFKRRNRDFDDIPF